jgi:hypothetical protein
VSGKNDGPGRQRYTGMIAVLEEEILNNRTIIYSYN